MQVREATGYARLLPLPYNAVQAILLLLGTWFEVREGVVTGTIATAMPIGIRSICLALRP